MFFFVFVLITSLCVAVENCMYFVAWRLTFCNEIQMMMGKKNHVHYVVLWCGLIQDVARQKEKKKHTAQEDNANNDDDRLSTSDQWCK